MGSSHSFIPNDIAASPSCPMSRLDKGSSATLQGGWEVKHTVPWVVCVTGTGPFTSRQTMEVFICVVVASRISVKSNSRCFIWKSTLSLWTLLFLVVRKVYNFMPRVCQLRGLIQYSRELRILEISVLGNEITSFQRVISPPEVHSLVFWPLLACRLVFRNELATFLCSYFCLFIILSGKAF